MGCCPLCFCPMGTVRSQPPEPKVAAVPGFDMAVLSRGTFRRRQEARLQEFVYKKTPQGELRIYFAMPADWAARTSGRL